MAAMPYLYMVHTIKYKMAWGVLEKIGRAIMNLNFAKFLLPTTYFIVVWSFYYFVLQWYCRLTHWGRVTHICVGKLTIIGSHNDLSPERRQAIIWTNAEILLIGPLGTNFNGTIVEIQTFSLKKIRLKMSSAKCCSFRLGLNVLYHNDNAVQNSKRIGQLKQIL